VADHPRIEELRRRIEKDPASIAFAQLAEECRRAGRFQEAVETCRTGLTKHPGYLSARVTLGRALVELNQLDDALVELELVLKSAPENLSAIRGVAEIHHRRGHLAEALDRYRAALALARNDPDLERTVQELSQELEPAIAAPVVTDGLSLAQMTEELSRIAPPPAPPSPEPKPPEDEPSSAPAAAEFLLHTESGADEADLVVVVEPDFRDGLAADDARLEPGTAEDEATLHEEIAGEADPTRGADWAGAFDLSSHRETAAGDDTGDEASDAQKATAGTGATPAPDGIWGFAEFRVDGGWEAEETDLVTAPDVQPTMPVRADLPGARVRRGAERTIAALQAFAAAVHVARADRRP
jgi:tetratricopeptide (TPR) repeat protein